MDKRYDVDDILAEIKRKKQGRDGAAETARPPRPVPPARREEPAREVRPPALGPQAPRREEPLQERPAPQAPRWEEPFQEAPPAPRVIPRREEAPPAQEPAPTVRFSGFALDTTPDDEKPAPSVRENMGQRRSRIVQKWSSGDEDVVPPPPSGKEKREPKHPKFQEEPAPVPQAPARGGFQFEFVEDEQPDGEPTRMDIPLADLQAEPAYEEERQPRHRREVMAEAFGGGGLGASGRDDDDAPLQADPDALEYNSPADAREVFTELGSLKVGLLIRLGITAVCFVLLTYLYFSYSYSLPLLTIIQPEVNPTVFFGVNLGVLVVAAVACSNTIGGGLIALFTLKADNDSFAAVAVLVSLIQGAALVISPTSYQNGNVHLYLPVAALILVFNTIGKLMVAGRLGRGFAVVAAKGVKHITRLVRNGGMARELTRGQNVDDPQVAYSTQAGFLSSYLELSYSEDSSDSVARVMVPVCLLAGILMSVISYIFNKDILVSLTVLTAVVCVSSPLTAMLVANLPLSLMSKRLYRTGSMISGYKAVDMYSEANSVAVRCSDLFPKGSIILNTIKVFQKNRIDEAILDAASVICSCDSPLTAIFTEMIGGRTEILREVETLTYEDTMGLSAWVDGKRVLIGNRELMRHHSIEIPSLDYERRFTEGGHDVVYLSNSGELTAMYVLTYGPTTEVEDSLSYLASRNMSLVVYSTDPNVTAQKLEAVFGYPADHIRLIPAKIHQEFDQMADYRESARAYMAHNGSLAAYVQSLLMTKLCKSTITVSTIMQILAVIIGFTLVTFFAFMQSMASISTVALLAYQLFWAFAIMLFPNLKRL